MLQHFSKMLDNFLLHLPPPEDGDRSAPDRRAHAWGRGSRWACYGWQRVRSRAEDRRASRPWRRSSPWWSSRRWRGAGKKPPAAATAPGLMNPTCRGGAAGATTAHAVGPARGWRRAGSRGWRCLGFRCTSNHYYLLHESQTVVHLGKIFPKIYKISRAHALLPA
jgi:hypothetical protein